jgi:hypothetical protein
VAAIEHRIVVQLIGRSRGLRLAELHAAFTDLDAQAVERAIAGLQVAGIVTVKRTRIHATEATHRLDALGLICI